MGIFDALKFWKRNEPVEPGAPLPGFPGGDPGFDTGLDNLGLDKNGLYEPQTAMPTLPGAPGAHQNAPTPSGYSLEPAAQRPDPGFIARQVDQSDIIMNKNMEIISSKLDALQASLESVSQRITSIERIAQLEQQKAMQKKYSY